MADEQTDEQLIVNVRTRIVHRSSCWHAGAVYQSDPLPLELWPEDERDQLRACGNCTPTGWR